ncbi:cGMP-dependent protein kinase, isozyme 1-like [Portunus trituberculatus]|uniref:cGMP-dependent protein kinase, isozyme 1-like n=1 Tax=Portunus trituberculatus TaxID=210409 RepID=UPI001E1CBA83|nr:cGMP-dependent protein kinase, isozyme 1-like [Portunus trituberculatus]XP_045103911.1 cGMP-dependent protein kinase, isozyme 1-like [Portunus trituberculatus]
MEYPDSVREMSRMLQEAALNEGTPTPPESPAQTPAGCQPCAATTQPPDLNGGTAIHQCQQKEKSSDPSAAGGGVEAGGVAGGGADVERPASTSGPVSLSQILDRPVYAAAAPLSSQHPTAPAPPQAPAPQPSSMPVATMGNGTSGQTGGHHHHHHHHHNHHQDGLPGGPGPGNGRGAPKPVYPEDYNYLKGLVPELKAEVRDRDLRIDVLEAEKMDMRRQLKKTTEEATRLRREVHKLKSVLQQQEVRFAGDGDLLSTLHEQHVMAGQGSMNKKQGVSGESCFQNKTAEKIHIQRFDKDFRSKQLIKDAVMDNDFLKHLDVGQVREIVDSMYPQEFAAGSWVIREGDVGSHLYVSAMGELEVVKDGDILGRMSSGKAFGELAILYNCTRTASIKAVTNAKVWVLDRRVFQQVMMRSGLKRMEDNINFLSSVPLFQNLNKDHLTKIADALEVDFYAPGTYIIRQGTSGDSFYILKSGKVRVTQRITGKSEEEEIRTLQKGNYFGEQALMREECRTANVIAMAPGVECLTLDRESFIQLIGDLSELREKDYGDESRGVSRPTTGPHNVDAVAEYAYIRLDDLDVIATLGVGGFGRVELVQYTHEKNMTFALKCLKKQHIVETQQQEHIYSEKRIMMSVHNPFIARLYKTFRDHKYVYMMMEACLGGEVWTLLRDRGWFEDLTARFYTACVVEALEFLHAKNIIYRDLKPENLLLDSTGYAKLVDFGFSKKLGLSSKTWTFCGTPEYVAPEIILNKGHDKAVDYWSIGILMYELLTGTPPFTASDPMKTYNIILKGIDMIDFPQHVTRTATSLIKRLCRESPAERLGYQRNGIQDIKKHKWFLGFDWDGLKARSLQPPIIPKIRNPTDTSNFDAYPRDVEVPADELSGWDLDF